MNRIRMLNRNQRYEENNEKLSRIQHYEQNKGAKKLSRNQRYEENKDAKKP